MDDKQVIDDDLIELIGETLRVDKSSLAPDQSLKALGMDSVQFVELVFAIEEKYSITVPFNANAFADAVNSPFASVGDLLALVKNTVHEQAKGTVAL
jgi:acyl carrier protein